MLLHFFRPVTPQTRNDWLTSFEKIKQVNRELTTIVKRTRFSSPYDFQPKVNVNNDCLVQTTNFYSPLYSSIWIICKLYCLFNVFRLYTNVILN